MIEVRDKDIKTPTITESHMFKKLEERLSMLSRVMEDIKKTQIKFLEMSTICQLYLDKTGRKKSFQR